MTSEWYDQAGRLHRTSVQGGIPMETIILHPHERLPEMQPSDELVLEGEQPFNAEQLLLKFKQGKGRQTMVARIGTVEALIQRREDERYEGLIIRGQTRISSRTSQPDGWVSPIPAMVWCDRQARRFTPESAP